MLAQQEVAAEKITMPHIEVQELSELTIADGRFPTLAKNGQVLHLLYFRSSDDVERLEMRRIVNGEVSPPMLVSASPSLMVNWADRPQFVAGRDGSSVITWLESTKAGYGIKYKFAREDGAAYTEARWLHTDMLGAEHGFVSLVPLAEGGFFAVWLQGGVWEEGQQYSTSLVGVVINAAGEAQSEFVLDPLVCDCCDTDAEIFASGNVVVTYRDRAEDEIRDIYYVRGNPLQPESFTAPVAVAADGWKPEGCPVNGPAIANSGRYTAILSFCDKRWSVPRLQISQSKGGGKKFGLPSLVSAKDTLGRANIAYSPEGIPVVAWLQQIGEEVWWVAKAVSAKGQTGWRSKISLASTARASGFIELLAVDDGVIATYNNSKGGVGFSRIKLKQASADKAEVKSE